ncbi:MAG: hypothetical protein CML04_11510 [Pseudozobellia sp.]|nr:hypothetical protein [Pseudozobellia sp.]MBG50373.1 hypothetical protein [Pseudozobellia sp.]|tara:strand:+ start:460 stop:1359 length:900 start_codon:yes stop_codon:yes gene_type:complete
MFSIITPTYNRQNELHRVYDSLKIQSYRNFQWIIIDDASTDSTDKLVEEWTKENNDFEIHYHKLKENRGKPFALNFGLDYCTQPITVIADSDDSFSHNTLEDLNVLWTQVNQSEESQKVGSIWTLVKDEEGKLVGELYPKNFWQVDFKQRVLNRKRKVQGEKWHSWRTEILRKYQFFHNDNTNYIGESATWTKINKDYDFLCVNIKHRTYYNTADGLINQQKSKTKVAKINYYTTFFQLRDANFFELLSIRYYRTLGFTYIKSNMYYNDSQFRLNWIKKFACLLAFMSISVEKIIERIS